MKDQTKSKKNHGKLVQKSTKELNEAEHAKEEYENRDNKRREEGHEKTPKSIAKVEPKLEVEMLARKIAGRRDKLQRKTERRRDQQEKNGGRT